MNMRTEPKVDWAMNEPVDPKKPYLYPYGSLENFFGTTAQTEYGKEETRARTFSAEFEMKPVLQDVRLPPDLTRYI